MSSTRLYSKAIADFMLGFLIILLCYNDSLIPHALNTFNVVISFKSIASRKNMFSKFFYLVALACVALQFKGKYL